MLDLSSIAKDLFHQIILQDYGNFDAISIDPPVPLEEVCQAIGCSTKSLKKLNKMKMMFEDYFAIKIENNFLSSLPVLIDNFSPSVNHIYKLVSSLCTNINWNSEKEALSSIAESIADFYSTGPSLEQDKNCLLNMLKSNIYKPRDFGSSLPYKKVTGLPDLYKVFERC